MSKETIWNRLRQAGLTEAGAAGLMGNMWAESLLKSNIVEKRCRLSDEEYTAGVDNGKIDFLDSVTAFGYGLCQWTYAPRKAALLAYAKNRGKSIGDEEMQVEFCLAELQSDYSSLFGVLCTSKELYTTTYKVCVEYERPAVNNIASRYQYAQRILDEFKEVKPVAPEKEFPPILRRGSKGIAVGMVQFALTARGYDLGNFGTLHDGIDCDFGEKTETALKEFCGATIVTEKEWRLLC